MKHLRLFFIIATVSIFFISCDTQKNITDKKKPIVEKKKPVFKFPLNTSMVINDYKKDEKNADWKYKNRVLIVKGVLTEQYKNKEGLVVIVLSSNKKSFGISCTMYTNKQITRPLKIGETVQIKGFCLGKKEHVLLGKCVFVK